MELAFVQSGLLGRYLDSEVVSAEEVAALLRRRGLLDGMPVFLDDETMMPLPALSEWSRYLATGLLDETTLRDYGWMAARLDGYLAGLGSDVLSATESDLVAYRNWRRLWQKKPVAARTWGKEASMLDDLYRFLVARGSLPAQPVRLAARGRNALAPGVRSNMDIRHLTFEQYRYFRDVSLGGQLPDEQVNRGYRGWAPLRNRAGSDLALGTGARWREWATVLLPEMGLWPGMQGGSSEFEVQACAKYGKARTLYVPEDAAASADLFCVLERPEIVRAAARTLERKARDLFVVAGVDVAGGVVRGTLDGLDREFRMSAMPAKLRRITLYEGEFGLEALTLFVCRGGLMPGADAWRGYRHRAWEWMTALADSTTPHLPARRWRWHDLRHTYAQIRADAGVPLDVLQALMSHQEPSTTQAYYRVSHPRRVDAVRAIAAKYRFDLSGGRVRPLTPEADIAERIRAGVGSVPVPAGQCHEMNNVRADGHGCPVYYRCFSCKFFTTDFTQLTELRQLRASKTEQLARLEGAYGSVLAPGPLTAAQLELLRQEIAQVDELIGKCEADLDSLGMQERATVDAWHHSKDRFVTVIPVAAVLAGRQRIETPTIDPILLTGQTT
ncbi:tyrosine-type recombinase/integrase [Streptomyces sp. NPDC058000]|uniref:tyrosine-type recombinase/integrase n=1 Tax=Streptomyces sp. NPDC058000 TaxID=3346299 RepID=UPI0036EA87BD